MGTVALSYVPDNGSRAAVAGSNHRPSCGHHYLPLVGNDRSHRAAAVGLSTEAAVGLSIAVAV